MFYRRTFENLKKIIEKENLTPDDFGIDDRAKYLKLKTTNDKSAFKSYLDGCKEVFPDEPVDIISRKEDPERFKREVDEVYSKHVPSIKEYDHCLFRKMVTLDTTKLGERLLHILGKRDNVRVLTSADVASYEVQ